MNNIRETLLFVHGWATDNTVWKRQIAAFSDNYRCLAPNLPGHGNNLRWSDPTIGPAVGMILRVLEKEHHGETVAVGWSLGAQVILQAALLKPGCFKAVILVGATPRFVKAKDFPWGQTRGVTGRMEKDLKSDFTATLNGFYALNFTPREGLTGEAQSFVSHYAAQSATLHQASLLASLGALVTTDLRADLNRLSVPALVIHGDADQIVPPGAGAYLAEQIPVARLDTFSETGHIPFLTRTERFNSAVENFLGEL